MDVVINNIKAKIFGAVILGLAGIMILILVFSLGVFIGEKKAKFSYNWAESYARNFGGPPGGVFGIMRGDEFINTSGVFGRIIKIEDNKLTVMGRDNVEKIVIVATDTSLICQKNDLQLPDLKVGDEIVVIGEPNSDGQIIAKFIRVLPVLPPISSFGNIRFFKPLSCKNCII